MKKTLPYLALLVSVLFALILAGTVSAQEQPPLPSDDDVNRVAAQMYCPVCENIPLDVCDTQACVQWRALISEKLAAGWTDEQIKDYFVLQYGDRVLAEPPRSGFNWLVYLIPLVFFAGGVYVLLRIFRNMRPQLSESEPASTEQKHPDPYENRVEEALRQRRK